MRVYIGLILNYIANYLNNLIPVLLHSEALIKFTQNKYLNKDVISSLTDKTLVESGFTEWEKKILSYMPMDPRKVLVLFCGGGRECVTLAKMGYEVTGIDFVSEIIRRAKMFAQKANIRINYQVQNVNRLNLPSQYFDYVLALRYMYSSIPGKKNRINVLRNLNKTLVQGGKCIFDFILKKETKIERKMFRLNKIIRYLFFGNRDYQVGDRIYDGSYFIHYFSSEREICEEVQIAGFEIDKIHTEGLNYKVGAIIASKSSKIPVYKMSGLDK